MSQIRSPEETVPPTADAVDQRTEAHFRLCLATLDSLVADAAAEPARFAEAGARAKSLAGDLAEATRTIFDGDHSTALV